MSRKNPGIIYEISPGRFGLAYHREQRKQFAEKGQVFVHVFTDMLCTIPELHPVTEENYSTLKHISKLKKIGYAD